VVHNLGLARIVIKGDVLETSVIFLGQMGQSCTSPASPPVVELNTEYGNARGEITLFGGIPTPFARFVIHGRLDGTLDLNNRVSHGSL
jgi:hypothetical protein